MNTSDTQRARRTPTLAGTIVGLLVVSLGLGSCSTTESPARAQGSSTVAITPIVPATAEAATTAAAQTSSDAPATSTQATAAPATTTPTTSTPTTAAITTTEAPTTTLAPETTTTLAAETTTTLPPETTTTLAPNEELVGAFPTPIPAVGRRSGAETQVVQLRLLQLGFWLSGADGEFGLTTRQAVMAFQKYIGLPATSEVDEATAAYLTNLAIRGHGRSDAGTLVEIDKARQLLFVVVDGKTQWIYNTSTATGETYEEEDKNTPGEIIKGVSITPDGLWKVNRERPDGWWPGDLGEIYRPKYFRGGVAVHGSNSIPNYPASHGCVRLSVPAMNFIWDWNLMPMGITVWVHDKLPG